MRGFLTSSEAIAIRGVSKIPGAIVLILIPILARSLAIGSVMAVTPPLLALYAA